MTTLLIELHYIMISMKPVIHIGGCLVASAAFIMVMKE